MIIVELLEDADNEFSGWLQAAFDDQKIADDFILRAISMGYTVRMDKNPDYYIYSSVEEAWESLAL